VQSYRRAMPDGRAHRYTGAPVPETMMNPDQPRLRMLALRSPFLLVSLLTACDRGTGATAAGIPAAELTPAKAYAVCAPCHRADGLGVPNAYPTLVGTRWVAGDPEVLIKVTLHGLQGPITVNGRPWNAMMAPFQHLPDAQISAALTHARTSWGHAASPITASQVAKVRAEHAARTRPWTSAELGNPR
jgi:mono/diheme cytochrome c family protein